MDRNSVLFSPSSKLRKQQQLGFLLGSGKLGTQKRARDRERGGRLDAEKKEEKTREDLSHQFSWKNLCSFFLLYSDVNDSEIKKNIEKVLPGKGRKWIRSEKKVLMTYYQQKIIKCGVKYLIKEIYSSLVCDSLLSSL